MEKGKIKVGIFSKIRQAAEQGQEPQLAEPRVIQPPADIQKVMAEAFGAKQPPPVLRLGAQPVIVEALPSSGVVLFRLRDGVSPWIAVYHSVLASRVQTEYQSAAQKYDEVKIIPWETLAPGTEQVAAHDLMVTRYGQECSSFAISSMEEGGKWVDWSLPCDPPPVPPL